MLLPFNATGIGQTKLSLWPKISLFSLLVLLSACGGGGSDEPDSAVVVPIPEESNDPSDTVEPDPDEGEGPDETEEPDPVEEDSYQVSLTVSETTITEGASSTLTFSLNQTNNTSQSVVVYYSLSGSSSQDDYQELGESIEIPANTLSASLTVNTLDDSIVEATESLQISLTAQSLPENFTLVNNASVEISIRDNDSAQDSYDLTTRAGSQAFYDDEYLGSAFSANSWSGKNDNSCIEGSIPSDVKDKTTQRLNYFRTLVGVKTIDHDATLNVKAQKGAHVAQIQFDLGVTLTSAFHVPNEDNGNWICLDGDAAQAMGASSIAQVGSSWNAADTVDLFVWDPGVNNSSAGHRDNLFRSDVNAVGIGAADQAVLIMTENNGDPTGMWTWPPALYVPKQILYSWQEFSRWSVRNEKAFLKWKNKEDNGGVTPSISVTDCEGENITVQNIKIADNKLLTWEVDSNAADIVSECEYQVSIQDYYVVQEEGNGAATGSLTTLNYVTTLFNAE